MRFDYVTTGTNGIHPQQRGYWHRQSHWEALNNSYFVVILHYSQKIAPHISFMCGVDIFCSRQSHLELELAQTFLRIRARAKPRRTPPGPNWWGNTTHLDDFQGLRNAGIIRTPIVRTMPKTRFGSMSQKRNRRDRLRPVSELAQEFMMAAHIKLVVDLSNVIDDGIRAYAQTRR